MKLVATLLHFLLVESFVEARAFSIEQSVKVRKLANKNYLASPEFFRNGSFAFAVMEKPSETELKLDVVIIGSNSRENCSLTVKADESSRNLGVNSLRRLSEKKVLFEGHEEQESGKRNGILILLDVRSCEPLYFSAYLPEVNALVTRESSDKFDVFMTSGASFCDIDRVTFAPVYQELHCFKSDLVWPDVQIKPVDSYQDVYVILGYDASQTFRMLLYSPKTPKMDNWFSLPRAPSKMQAMSSDLGLCWMLNPGGNGYVQCSLFSHDGQLIFNKTVSYDEPVRLLFVLDLSNSSKILVITGNTRSDSSVVVISKVSDKSIDHRTLKLSCSEHLHIGARQITRKGAVAVEYICDDVRQLAFNSVLVSDF